MSASAQKFLARQEEPAISDLVELELFSGLAKRVRAGDMRAADAQVVQAAFLGHLNGGLYLRLPVERRHYAIARDWLAAVRPTLAALDALHLVVAAAQPCLVVTADSALARAARALGLSIRLLR